MRTDTRTKMVEATIAALQRHGVAGMSFTEVLRDSGAARGAIYHHFPGGKAQMVAEAAARNGHDVRAHFAELPAESPRAVVEAFLAGARPVVEAAAMGSGCAVAAVTIEGEGDDGTLREVAAGAFGAWIDQLTERLTTSGLEPEDAADLATTLVTLLEGTQVLCRAAGTVASFDRTVRTALALVPE